MKKTGALVLACICFILTATGCIEKQQTNEFLLNQTIQLLHREQGSGTKTSFLDFLCISERELVADNGDTVSGTDVMLSAVENEEYAIGYVSQSNLTEKVKAISVNGILPTKETVQSGTYSFTRELNLVTKASVTLAVQDFLNFIKSQGQLIDTLGYISIYDEGEYISIQPKGTIKISGSSSVYPLMNALAENYRQVNPNAYIEINQTDSDNGIENVKTGISDIAMSSRKLTGKEEVDTVSVNIAKDAIAVIVNRKNPITDVTIEQLKNVYLGTTTTWNKIK